MSTAAVPTKPWAKSPQDRILGLTFFLAAILFSYFFVAATELKGKLAYAFIFFIAYAVITSTHSFIIRGPQAAKDSFVSTLVALGAVATVTPIASILFTVVKNGAPGLHPGILSNDMSMAAATDPIASGGVLHAITGTLTMVVLALLMSVPIGILTALYLTEVRGKFAGPVRFLVQAMSGVPSIVAGLFVLSAVIYPITKGYSALMGALALHLEERSGERLP